MTIDDALLIKGWRLEGATWRRVSIRANDEWPDRGYEPDNQLEGRELCLEAQTVLDERWD